MSNLNSFPIQGRIGLTITLNFCIYMLMLVYMAWYDNFIIVSQDRTITDTIWDDANRWFFVFAPLNNSIIFYFLNKYKYKISKWIEENPAL
jgi:hypothetical protein